MSLGDYVINLGTFHFVCAGLLVEYSGGDGQKNGSKLNGENFHSRSAINGVHGRLGLAVPIQLSETESHNLRVMSPTSYH